MPRILNPTIPKAGPGSVFADTNMKSKGRRRRGKCAKAQGRPGLDREPSEPKDETNGVSYSYPRIAVGTRNLVESGNCASATRHDTEDAMVETSIAAVTIPTTEAFRGNLPQNERTDTRADGESSMDQKPAHNEKEGHNVQQCRSSAHKTSPAPKAEIENCLVKHPNMVSKEISTGQEVKIALGMDTRCCLSHPPSDNESAGEASMKLGYNICRDYMEFLLTGWECHDILPHCFVSTITPSNDINENQSGDIDEKRGRCSTSVVLQFETEATLRRKLVSEEVRVIAPVWCRAMPSGDNSNPQPKFLSDQDSVLSAKALRPKSSWKMLQQMVFSMLPENESIEGQQPFNSWHISLITTDLAMFRDLRASGSHQEGITRFFKSLLVHKHCKLQVRIYVVATRAGSVDTISSSGLSPKDEILTLDKEEGRNEFNRVVSNSVQALQTTLIRLRNETPSSPEVSIEIVDQCPASLQLLWEPWIDILLSKKRCSKPLVWELDLPETWEGVQSKLYLKLHFHVLPMMTTPMMLSSFFDYPGNAGESTCSLLTSLVPIQLAPMESLDASLLFGLPMTVTAGMHEAKDGDNEQQKQDMEILAQCLFQELHNRNQVLVLKGQYPVPTRNMSGATIKKPQLYILMAREGPDCSQADHSLGFKVNSGILFRYASGTELLSTPIPAIINGETDAVVEHVQQALDCLPCHSTNPFLTT